MPGMVLKNDERRPDLLRWNLGSGKNVNDILRGGELVARRSVIIAGLSLPWTAGFSLARVAKDIVGTVLAKPVVEAALEGSVHLLRLRSDDPDPTVFA